MANPTLKHIINGTVFTRTTKNEYTHVVEAEFNVEGHIAAVERSRTYLMNTAERNARYVWNMPDVVTGVESVEDYVAKALSDEKTRLDAIIEEYKTRRGDIVVLSWHKTAENAAKAANNKRHRGLWFTKTDRINGGN